MADPYRAARQFERFLGIGSLDHMPEGMRIGIDTRGSDLPRDYDSQPLQTPQEGTLICTIVYDQEDGSVRYESPDDGSKPVVIEGGSDVDADEGELLTTLVVDLQTNKVRYVSPGEDDKSIVFEGEPDAANRPATYSELESELRLSPKDEAEHEEYVARAMASLGMPIPTWVPVIPDKIDNSVPHNKQY